MLLSLAACDKAPSHEAARPTPEVVVYRVAPTSVPISIELAGRVTASAVAEIRPQVGGILLRRTFVEGREVKAGQVLYEIDPSAARAEAASAQATLASAQAALVSAREKAARYEDLVKIEAVSQESAEEAQAAYASARSNVATAEANLSAARLALGYTRVKAPISGRIGRSNVTQGALVTAGQATALATVQQLDPVYVDAPQSAAELLRIRREIASGRVQLASGSRPVARLVLEDGREYEHPGELLLAEAVVDEQTGSVALRAQFPNPDRVLLPGMYVRLTIEGAVSKGRLVVPQVAVSRDAKGNAIVMLVGQGERIEQRAISAQRAVGNQWIVDRGLASGDRVVVEGLQNIRAGSVVKVVNPAQQPASTTPARPASGAAASSSAAMTASPAAATR